MQEELSQEIVRLVKNHMIRKKGGVDYRELTEEINQKIKEKNEIENQIYYYERCH